MKYTNTILTLIVSFVLFFFPVLGSGTVASDPLNIALILWRGETPAEQGFKNEMKKLGYDVRYTVFNAEQDKSRINNILREEVQPEKFDYIYTFGTTVSVKTKNILGGRTAQIFNVVSYPLKSGLV